MDFNALSHLIQICLFPPGLILLMMLFSYLIGKRWPYRGEMLGISAFFFFWLLSTPFVAEWLIDPLQNQFKPFSFKQTTGRGALVVLGSGIENASEYTNKHTVSEKTLSRLHYTAYVAKKMHLPVIVSGGNRDYLAYTEAQLMRDELMENYHIQPLAEEKFSKNTLDESRYVVPIIKYHGISVIYLVTHAWHMPRSLYAFNLSCKPIGVTVIPVPMGYIKLKSTDRIANYLPSMNALNTSVFAIHEYIGLAWYHLFAARFSRLQSS